MKIVVVCQRRNSAHYRGLEVDEWVELDFGRESFKDLTRGDLRSVGRRFRSLSTWRSLVNKHHVFVIGIAPWDWRMLFLERWARSRNVLYFTSWVEWSGDMYPRRTFGQTDMVRRAWRQFIERRVYGIGAVSQASAAGLRAKFATGEVPITPLGHAVEDRFLGRIGVETSGHIRVGYLGRLEASKGIDRFIELAEAFADDPSVAFEVAGDGRARSAVVAADEAGVLTWRGQISRSAVADWLGGTDYLVMAGRRTQKWEEVYGIAIIEALLSGCSVLAPAHAGPTEIADRFGGISLVEDGPEFVEHAASLLRRRVRPQLNEREQLRSETDIEARKERWASLISGADGRS